MTSLPDEFEIVETKMTTKRLLFTKKHVKMILQEWAKTRGLSHRAEIEIWDGKGSITETLVTS